MHTSSKAQQSVYRDFAESTALSALTFLAADPRRLERFLAVTGLGPHNLRSAAEDPDFYASILEYMVGDERLLIDFASYANLSPEAVEQARQSLCGPPPV
jgi:hypothetical protein